MPGWPSGGPSNLTAADDFGAIAYGKLRDADLAAVFCRHELGGSRATADAVTGTSYQDAFNYRDFIIPDAASAGAVWVAEVELVCENAATTITPRIRNITDSSDAVVGAACAATTWGGTNSYQTLSFTPVVGKRYRLQFIKSDDVYGCWGVGAMRRTNA